MATGDTMGYAVYQSDDGVNYQVRCSSRTASEGGFSGFSASKLVNPFWPYPAKDLRHVTGKNGAKHGRLPIGTPDNSKFVAGGSFTIDAGPFTITGSEGENRKASHAR